MAQANITDQVRTTNPRVSVVIPTHGRDGLLREAIGAAVEQRLRPDEVWVCDDLGSPATRRVVDEWSVATAGLVRYVDTSGPGAGTAGASRNRGAQLATGELLAFLDDDDLWRPDHLERLVAGLGDRADFAVSWTEADEPTWRFARMREGLTARQVVSRNPGFVGSNFVVRAATYRAVGGFDPALRVSNDQDLLVRLLAHDASYRVVPEVTLVNRIHEGPQLTDKTEARARAVLTYYRKHRALMGWRDRLVIATIVAGIRRVCAPTAPRRAAWTVATAAGRAGLLVLAPNGREARR